jgi:hypothetical protein
MSYSPIPLKKECKSGQWDFVVRDHEGCIAGWGKEIGKIFSRP